MKVAHRICQARSDVIFVVVGGEEIHYGWDKLHTGSPSFKQWVLSQGDYDLSPIHLPGADLARATGRHPPDQRPAHLPDRPVRALVVAPGRDGERLRVLASDVPPVREVIEAGRTAWSSRSSTSTA